MGIPELPWDNKLRSAVREISSGARAERAREFWGSERQFFAHYTSAATVEHILNSKAFFMRNARLMNDHSEVWHGFASVLNAIGETGGGAEFKQAWADLDSDLAHSFQDRIQQIANLVIHNCFITSVCEHDNADDDGLLSMWRAYGNGDLRVAAILRAKEVVPLAGGGTLLLPCFYGTEHDVGKELGVMADSIARHTEVLKGLSQDQLIGLAIGVVTNFAVTIKHPGFSEEREWRFIYMSDFPSPEMINRRKTVVLGGVPQIVYQLPFVLPDDDTFDPQRQFLEKLVLGPCNESATVRAGLVALLERYHIPGADDLVIASGIPYRQRM